MSSYSDRKPPVNRQSANASSQDVNVTSSAPRVAASLALIADLRQQQQHNTNTNTNNNSDRDASNEKVKEDAKGSRRCDEESTLSREKSPLVAVSALPPNTSSLTLNANQLASLINSAQGFGGSANRSFTNAARQRMSLVSEMANKDFSIRVPKAAGDAATMKSSQAGEDSIRACDYYYYSAQNSASASPQEGALLSRQTSSRGGEWKIPSVDNSMKISREARRAFGRRSGKSAGGGSVGSSSQGGDAINSRPMTPRHEHYMRASTMNRSADGEMAQIEMEEKAASVKRTDSIASLTASIKTRRRGTDMTTGSRIFAAATYRPKDEDAVNTLVDDGGVDAPGSVAPHPALLADVQSSHNSVGWFDGIVDDDSDNGDGDGYGSNAVNALYEQFQGKGLTYRKRLKYILDGNPHHKDARISFVVNAVLFIAILVSIVVYCVQSFPSFYGENNVALQSIEYVCVGIFILEALGRVVSSSSYRALLNFFFIVDIISIIGFFLDLILRYTTSGGGAGLSVVRVVRLVRVFRVLKFSRHSQSLQVVLLVLSNSMSSLMVLMVPIILITTIAACLLYYVEISSSEYSWDAAEKQWKVGGEKANIQSIPDALWFSLATVTTVGFGDTIVTTIAARTLAAFLQLIGVLMINFPNIILGGNVQVAYKEYQRHRAYRKLGKKFRRVYMIMCFIAALREKVEIRQALILKNKEEGTLMDVAGDDVGKWSPLNSKSNADESADPAIAKGGGKAAHTKRPLTNYFMHPSEAHAFRKLDVLPITPDTVRQWSYKGIGAIAVLQRLFELCSGVGTTEELHQAFIENGNEGVGLKDIDVVVLHLLASEYLQVFAFKRFGVNMLCALTPLAVTELMVNCEEAQVDCIRSAETARVLWRRTTGSTIPYSPALLSNTYPSWAASERLADDEYFTPFLDMKELYDEEGNPKPLLLTSFFSRSYALGGGLDRSLRNPMTIEASQARRREEEERALEMCEDAKDTLKDVIAQRASRIRSLRAQIAGLRSVIGEARANPSLVSQLNNASRRKSALVGSEALGSGKGDAPSGGNTGLLLAPSDFGKMTARQLEARPPIVPE